MQGKKAERKFTIQFSRTDPAHLHVVDILNRLERCFKAQYIVDAILHYESRDAEWDTQPPAPIDARYVESLIKKVLRDREGTGDGLLPTEIPAFSYPVGQVDKTPQTDTDIAFGEAMDILGEDGLSAIAGALDMFRTK